MKTKFNPVLAQATQDKIAGDKAKLLPIPPGHVRFERHDYHYGQQGQVTLSHYTLKDLPENEVSNWFYGSFWLTWPDGESEGFDLRVTPCRHDFHKGFGKITRSNGTESQGTLSRVPGIFCEYYGPKQASPEELATFKPHVWD